MLAYTSKDSYSISFSYQKDSGDKSFCIGINGKSASGFTASSYGLGSSDTSIELNWFTIGY